MLRLAPALFLLTALVVPAAGAEPELANAGLPQPDNDPAGDDPGGDPRRGWWQRTFG